MVAVVDSLYNKNCVPAGCYRVHNMPLVQMIIQIYLDLTDRQM